LYFIKISRVDSFTVVLLKAISFSVVLQPSSSLGRLILRFLDHVQLYTLTHMR